MYRIEKAYKYGLFSALSGKQPALVEGTRAITCQSLMPGARKKQKLGKQVYDIDHSGGATASQAAALALLLSWHSLRPFFCLQSSQDYRVLTR
jgi:hypothetical protein